MKKIISIAFVALFFLSFLVSCKKDYTCTCTDSGVSLGVTTIKDTKKKATDLCKTQQTSWQLLDPTATCVLK